MTDPNLNPYATPLSTEIAKEVELGIPPAVGSGIFLLFVVFIFGSLIG